ncbi:uncharacterized protein LOC133196481 [Saccostrea echinata]|uniref:uncharacterized protein LOC133196481 n=1 Tax=Saccostrea echinata TaxID=191078 RepID=UPI002A82A432|nr:uncharacterized protein LOC133196481 [Saccostrea echinata]
MMEQKEQAIKRHISIIQKYEHSYELSAKRPVQFLLSIKKISISNRLHNYDTFAIIFNEEIKTWDVTEFLIKFEVMERRKRRVGSEEMLKLMSKPVLQKYVPSKNIPSAYHISHVTSDLVWVSHLNNVLLINTAGDTYHLNDVTISSAFGVHCMNKNGDLIYIDRNHNSSVISSDHTKRSILVKKSELWTPLCIYSSPSTGDLLVGMGTGYCESTSFKYISTKVIRYNSLGQHVHAIQYSDSGEKLYYHPTYITENQNEDIVVADFCCLKVTDYSGRHRFTYTGNPSVSENKFTAYGICTDALLNILVCDVLYKTVHLIDKDGLFLFYLFSEEQGFLDQHV